MIKKLHEEYYLRIDYNKEKIDLKIIIYDIVPFSNSNYHM